MCVCVYVCVCVVRCVRVQANMTSNVVCVCVCSLHAYSWKHALGAASSPVAWLSVPSVSFMIREGQVL